MDHCRHSRDIQAQASPAAGAWPRARTSPQPPCLCRLPCCTGFDRGSNHQAGPATCRGCRPRSPGRRRRHCSAAHRPHHHHCCRVARRRQPPLHCHRRDRRHHCRFRLVAVRGRLRVGCAGHRRRSRRRRSGRPSRCRRRCHSRCPWHRPWCRSRRDTDPIHIQSGVHRRRQSDEYACGTSRNPEEPAATPRRRARIEQRGGVGHGVPYPAAYRAALGMPTAAGPTWSRATSQTRPERDHMGPHSSL
jgi:hypothetical protein